ncbi:MAG TPA: DNA-binding response regulator, partial [Firmicutes bacterium]|nr:DNA-binding response regulator [Bacillota bacterium]
PFEQLEGFDTICEVKSWILSLYSKLVDAIELYQFDDGLSEVTKNAIRFMHQNYQKPISLRQIAEEIGVNCSYLSRKFKQECGQGVVDYLNSFRVKKAKVLIEQGCYIVKEVAEAVGFSNYNY